VSGVLQAFDEGAIFGARWGRGEPLVVALHGWGRSHHDFEAALGSASAGGPLASVGLDLPGFGASPAPSEPWGSARYADAVARVLVQVSGRPVVVVGHSLGGRVALQLGARHPGAVGALVLTGAPIGPKAPGAGRLAPGYRVARRLHRAHLLSEPAMERARQRYGSADYRAAAGVMRQILVRMVAEDYSDVVGRLRCPVELVWGADDTVAPPGMARWLRDQVPGAVLVECPEVGHLVPVAAPGALRGAVERALQRCGYGENSSGSAGSGR
jgi:pimeloyl-ACP methyl ester carboxylesterase